MFLAFDSNLFKLRWIYFQEAGALAVGNEPALYKI